MSSTVEFVYVVVNQTVVKIAPWLAYFVTSFIIFMLLGLFTKGFDGVVQAVSVYYYFGFVVYIALYFFFVCMVFIIQVTFKAAALTSYGFMSTFFGFVQHKIIHKGSLQKKK